MSRPHALKRFVTIAVLLSLCTAMFVSTSTRAANTANTKISPDLQRLILSGNSDARVTDSTLEAAVSSSGHVTNTTGAQPVRAQKALLGLNSTLDCSGVTIAVLE